MICATLIAACGVSLATVSQPVRAEDLSPLDSWAGIPSHPAKVNSVTPSDPSTFVSLAGEWDFIVKPYPTGISLGYCTQELWWPSNQVRKLTVPGCWEAQGVGDSGTSTPWACFWDASPKPIRHVHQGYGWYRRTVMVPSGWTGRRIWLKIGGTMSEGVFYVNGTPVARNHPYCGSYKYDITPFVKPGEPATVVVGVCNLRPTRRGGVAGMNRWGGIYRDIELEATPMERYIDDVWVRGDLDRQEAEVKVQIGGEVEKWRGGEVRVTVEGETKEEVLHSTPTPST